MSFSMVIGSERIEDVDISRTTIQEIRNTRDPVKKEALAKLFLEKVHQGMGEDDFKVLQRDAHLSYSEAFQRTAEECPECAKLFRLANSILDREIVKKDPYCLSIAAAQEAQGNYTPASFKL